MAQFLTAVDSRDARSRFPPLQRAQIVELACLEPVAEGLHITHWTSKDLARQIVADGIVPAISARTVRRILHEVDLQPHRTRYWRTGHLDAKFKAHPDFARALAVQTESDRFTGTEEREGGGGLGAGTGASGPAPEG